MKVVINPGFKKHGFQGLYIIGNQYNCVYTVKSSGYIQLFIHKRYAQCNSAYYETIITK